ncbi:MAG TPA: sigma-54 dependent transcriptional regulator [Burkholderiales bacterium]|nr:sigma-54 dependent transcriptional regulator [Burkholderiales bacterium]
MNSRDLLLVPLLNVPLTFLDNNQITQDWNTTICQGLDDAINHGSSGRFLVGLLSLDQAPERIEAVHRLIDSTPAMEWIALIPETANPSNQFSFLLGNHFNDFHTLPANPTLLFQTLGHAWGKAQIKRSQIEEQTDPPSNQEMVGSSPAMLAVFKNIRKIAGVDAPLLIDGESGTGKELAALAIHERSTRKNGPFVAVNCGSIPTNLIQSELFGHEKGAFTGAHQRKAGYIESAEGGTIFLDEIGDLPLDQQTSLLRFLQEKTITPVGSSKSITTDARVIAASHINLEEAVKAGKFREDLYYRLNVLYLKMPALRERLGDVELLSKYFFKRFQNEKREQITGFSQRALAVMGAYSWPGNVRELINRIRRAMVMCETRLIEAKDLGLDRRGELRNIQSLDEIRDKAEKLAITSALARSRFNVSLAARDLKISRITLYRLIEKYQINNNPSS